jgi:hypothetical protein
VRFASFLSGGFTTMAAKKPLENKLEKRNSVLWDDHSNNPSTHHNY